MFSIVFFLKLPLTFSHIRKKTLQSLFSGSVARGSRFGDSYSNQLMSPFSTRAHASQCPTDMNSKAARSACNHVKEPRLPAPLCEEHTQTRSPVPLSSGQTLSLPVRIRSSKHLLTRSHVPSLSERRAADKPRSFEFECAPDWPPVQTAEV